jgi:hypothetical protein
MNLLRHNRSNLEKVGRRIYKSKLPSKKMGGQNTYISEQNRRENVALFWPICNEKYFLCYDC